MTTPSLLGSIDRLAHLTSATRGVARALDPDPVMSEHDRVNLYFLTMRLAEQLETCLSELTHVYQHLHVQEPRLPNVPLAQDRTRTTRRPPAATQSEETQP